MSWTQVHLSGLLRSQDPSDAEIETILENRYNLSHDTIMWAGPGTSLIKRDATGCCRGFGFLMFYSSDGAAIGIDCINNGTSLGSGDGAGGGDDGEEHAQKLPLQLRAELSNPKSGKQGKKNNSQVSGDLPDLRLRRQRKPPIRKHPVITSSDGKRTNLGNKTK